MLVELSVVEQRYQAVLAVLEGATVTEVASRFGVHRQTLHRWLRRYEAAGLAGLADRFLHPSDDVRWTQHPYGSSVRHKTVARRRRRKPKKTGSSK
ncbi:MAG TPA: helix-turn-helix domain-containing protein [Mycobacteriales bacterium]|nr:helix-turn-helix domain-containing protein [Mycobacteriales bacterium]